jgi:hypothetical protein
MGPTPRDFLAAIIFYAGQFSGGDKPRLYLFGETSSVMAGYIPVCKGQNGKKKSPNSGGSIVGNFLYVD